MFQYLKYLLLKRKLLKAQQIATDALEKLIIRTMRGGAKGIHATIALGCYKGIVMPAEGMPMVVDIAAGRDCLLYSMKKGFSAPSVNIRAQTIGT